MLIKFCQVYQIQFNNNFMNIELNNDFFFVSKLLKNIYYYFDVLVVFLSKKLAFPSDFNKSLFYILDRWIYPLTLSILSFFKELA